MNKKLLFEKWYTEGCSKKERERMIETVSGRYKLMQCHAAYIAFCAGLAFAEKLESAIKETLEDNRHLADGENCTLIKLKKAVLDT